MTVWHSVDPGSDGCFAFCPRELVKQSDGPSHTIRLDGAESRVGAAFPKLRWLRSGGPADAGENPSRVESLLRSVDEVRRDELCCE